MAAWYLSNVMGVKQQTPEGLFQKSSGERVEVVEQDGDVVLFRYARSGGGEHVGATADIVGFAELGPVQALRAIDRMGAGCGWAARSKLTEARLCVRAVGGKMHGCLAPANGSLVYRFFKQGGSVPHFLPVSAEDAVALLEGRKQLRYTKGGNTARLVEV